MRTLILTCNAGGGHNACAAAIAQAYHRQGLVCDTADALQFTSLRLSRFLSWGHTTMYRRIPGLFQRGYRFAEQHPSVMSDGSPLPRLLSAGSRRLYEYIRQGQYDAVLCVHVFAAVLLQQTLQDFPLTLRTGFVATDYTCSPGAAGDLDYYFIPHRSLCGEFIAGGTAPERLVISGIPIDRRFTADTQRPAAQPRHLVMMCGSMGCGPMEELTAFFLRHLPQEAALTVVCGSNEKLRRRLSELVQGHENIRICGFVTDMAELLDSADLCLTKPGGLSTTETAAMGVPMVLIDAVAGCEENTSHECNLIKKEILVMPTIYWAGDSTVQYNDIITYPQTGIGQVMHLFLKPEVTVSNHAKNGRSTKSFIDEILFMCCMQ